MRDDDADARHRALCNSLTGRFWLRFHMSLLLGVAFAAGELGSALDSPGSSSGGGGSVSASPSAPKPFSAGGGHFGGGGASDAFEGSAPRPTAGGTKPPPPPPRGVWVPFW